jgi:hypothetical protein
MEFLLKATKVSQRLSEDDRLTSSHISLYLALLIVWEKSLFVNPFTISRKQLMTIAKIGSFTTYHKMIRQLEEFGYIKYTPNFNSYLGSSVYLHIS